MPEFIPVNKAIEGRTLCITFGAVDSGGAKTPAIQIVTPKGIHFPQTEPRTVSGLKNIAPYLLELHIEGQREAEAILETIAL